MRKKKLIIHIGYPKTATSFLQKNLFNNLNNNGFIRYSNGDEKNKMNFYPKNIIKLITNQKEEINYTKLQKELNDINNINDETLLISDESISMRYANIDWHKMDSSAKFNAKEIKNILGTYFSDIKIVIAVRNQVSLIPSYCTEIYDRIIKNKKLDTDVLGDWLLENVIEKNKDDIIFNFNELYSHYVKQFGKSKVVLLVYEDLKYNKEDYITTLSSALDLKNNIIRDNLGVEGVHITRKHKGMSVNLAGTLSGRMMKYTSFIRANKIIFYYLRGFYHLLIPEKIRLMPLDQKALIRPLSENEVNFIFNKYKEDNSELIKQLNIDYGKMKKYKYI